MFENIEKPKDLTKVMFMGVPLERWRVVKAIEGHAIEYFKSHPYRNEYEYRGITFRRDEFDLNESVSDLDPYGEENWNETPEPNYYFLGRYRPRSECKKIIASRAREFFKKYPRRDSYYIEDVMFTREEFDLNESVDVDPYGEENWDNDGVHIQIITPKIAENKQNSFWYYNETIAAITKGDQAVNVMASGDIRVYFDEEDVKNHYYFEGSDAVEEAYRRSLTDADIDKLMEQDRFLNNNWFDVNDYGNYDVAVDAAWDDTYDEAIALGVQYVNELYDDKEV